MRPNVARRRMTFNGPRGGSPQKSYFVFRFEPMVDRRTVGRCVGVHVAQLVGAGLLVAMASLLPVNEKFTTHVYLPLIAFVAAPWIAELFGVPLGLLAILSIVVCFLVGTTLAPGETHLRYALGLGMVTVLGPFVVRLTMMTTVQRSRTLTVLAAGLFGLAGLLAVLDDRPLVRTPLHIVTGVGLTVFGILLIRTYAERLAGCPEVPVEGVIRLVRLSEWLCERRPGALLPPRSWWHCVAASGAGLAIASEFVQCWATRSCFDSNGQGQPEILGAWLIGACSPPLLCCLSLRCSPLQYARMVLRGMFRALVSWVTDAPPAVGAPGIRSSFQYSLFGVRARTALPFVLLLLQLITIVTERPCLGLSRFRMALRMESVAENVGHILSYSVESLVVLLSFLLSAAGPWLVYLEHVSCRSPLSHQEDTHE